jgi:hypothetical protein
LIRFFVIHQPLPCYYSLSSLTVSA